MFKTLRQYRWFIVGLLFLTAVVNNLDRQTLSVLAPTLRNTFGISAVEYSYIVSSFLAAYTLGYLFAGSVLDRVGVKVGLAVAMAFWSLVSGIAKPSVPDSPPTTEARRSWTACLYYTTLKATMTTTSHSQCFFSHSVNRRRCFLGLGRASHARNKPSS